MYGLCVYFSSPTLSLCLSVSLSEWVCVWDTRERERAQARSKPRPKTAITASQHSPKKAHPHTAHWWGFQQSQQNPPGHLTLESIMVFFVVERAPALLFFGASAYYVENYTVIWVSQYTHTRSQTLDCCFPLV